MLVFQQRVTGSCDGPVEPLIQGQFQDVVVVVAGPIFLCVLPHRFYLSFPIFLIFGHKP
jgi:hypothetical protein